LEPAKKALLVPSVRGPVVRKIVEHFEHLGDFSVELESREHELSWFHDFALLNPTNWRMLSKREEEVLSDGLAGF